MTSPRKSLKMAFSSAVKSLYRYVSSSGVTSSGLQATKTDSTRASTTKIEKSFFIVRLVICVATIIPLIFVIA